jgi:hypothetical protein
LADGHGSERDFVATYPDLPSPDFDLGDYRAQVSLACLNIGSLELLANELREELQPGRSDGPLVRA